MCYLGPGRIGEDLEEHKHYEGDKKASDEHLGPIVCYGAETWTMKKVDERRVNSFEMQRWRKMLRTA